MLGVRPQRNHPAGFALFLQNPGCFEDFHLDKRDRREPDLSAFPAFQERGGFRYFPAQRRRKLDSPDILGLVAVFHTFPGKRRDWTYYSKIRRPAAYQVGNANDFPGVEAAVHADARAVPVEDRRLGVQLEGLPIFILALDGKRYGQEDAVRSTLLFFHLQAIPEPGNRIASLCATAFDPQANLKRCSPMPINRSTRASCYSELTEDLDGWRGLAQ